MDSKIPSGNSLEMMTPDGGEGSLRISSSRPSQKCTFILSKTEQTHEVSSISMTSIVPNFSLLAMFDTSNLSPGTTDSYEPISSRITTLPSLSPIPVAWIILLCWLVACSNVYEVILISSLRHVFLKSLARTA